MGCIFLLESSTPQWGRGVTSAPYVLQVRVLFLLAFIPSDAQRIFGCVPVHSLVHMFMALYMHANMFALTFSFLGPLTIFVPLLCFEKESSGIHLEVEK